MLDEEAVQLARDVVAVASPDDIEDLEAIIRYQTSGAGRIRSGVGLSLELGAGGTLLVLLLPVLQKALVDLVERLSKLGVAAAEQAVKDWLAHRRSAAALTSAQAEEIVSSAVEFAKSKGLDQDACAALKGILASRIPVRA